MRIVHVIDYFHTDVGYQEYFLARDQARAGHQVRVVTSSRRQHTVAVPGADEEAGARELADANVEVVRLPSIQLGHDRGWIRGQARAIENHRPDVAHLHGPFCPTTVRALRTLRRLGVPSLVDNHIQEAIAPGSVTPLGRAFYAAYRLAAGPFLRRSVGAWVANGPHEGSFLRRRLGLPRGAVELMPLAFDPAVHSFDQVRRDEARRTEGWKEGELVVAVTGKLHEGKRVDVVAEAAEKVAESRQVRLVLAGSISDDYLDRVRAAAPTLEAETRIEMKPMLDRQGLADLYLASDVVLFARLPSISIYEAAGSGVRLLVGKDDFADWLHLLLPAIESVELDALPTLLAPAEDRDLRSVEAASVLGWPAISAAFIERYRELVAAP